MVIRRKLALLGLFFLLCQLAAAQIPSGVWIGLMAGCAAGFFVFCRFRGKRYALWMLFVFAVSLVGVQQLYLHFLVYPSVRQEQGTGLSLLVRVEETGSSYEDDRVSARVTVLESSGQSCHYTAYCSAFPYSEAGELVRGVFDVGDLPPDEYRTARLADGIYLELTYLSDASWEGIQYTPLLRIQQWRLMLSRTIRQYISFDTGSLLCAMTLGERTGMPEELERLFRQAGVSHLLVVSGLHLSLVCGLLTSSLRNSRIRAVANLVIFPLYSILTGLSPSILRAGTAMMIGSVGAIFGLPADPFTSLGIAALLLGIGNPFAACDVGLQLSFAATFGVLCAGAVYARATRHRFPVPLPWRVLNWILVPTLAAFFSLPVQLMQGMEISGVSVLSNLLSLYLIRPILVLGMLCAVCALAPFLAIPLGLLSRLAEMLIGILLAILRTTAALPFSRILLPTPYTLLVCLILLVLSLLFWHSRSFWKVALLALPACAVFAVFIGVSFSQGLVHIALLGTRSSPCLVAWQGENAVLVFQGGQQAVREVEDYLELRQLQLTLVLDIRRSGERDFWAQSDCAVYRLRQFAVGMQTSRQISDILIESFVAKDGNLARLSVGGYSIALCSGTVYLAHPMNVSLWVLGNSGQYSDIRADIRLSGSKLAGGDILYGEGDILEIRPGQSVRMIGVRHVDE